MAISSITYAKRLILVDNNNQEHAGIMQYNSGDKNMVSFPSDRKTVLTPPGESNTVTIIKLKNGLEIKLIIAHMVEFVSAGQYRHYYHYEIRGYINGAEVTDGALALPKVTDQGGGHLSPYPTYPLMDQVYVYFGGTYYDVSRPTVVGDVATYVDLYVSIWYKYNNTGYEDLIGDLDSNQGIVGHWNNLSNVPLANDDTAFNNAKNRMTEVGTGEDPFKVDEPAPEEPDPSGPGGGDKPSGDEGEPVDFPTLPTTNVMQSGLVSVYNPTNTQLRSLAQVLWGNDFEQTIKKILNDPFDGIIGLALIPFTPTTAGSENCVIGNFDTEVAMPLVSEQWITLNCGSLDIPASWSNALDYSPNTIIDIFIPFVGFRTLKTEDVMSKSISLKYNVDILSGAAVAMVKCGNKVMYTYPCKLTYDIPLTGSNRAALYTGMINIAMSAIKGAAMGGALGAAGGAATSALQTATTKQTDIDRSGSITSNTGDLGEFTPYIVIHRPVQSMPKSFKQIKGYQSNITAVLSSLSGYTEIDFIHLTGISGATDTELDEIERLLKEGVII